MEKAYNFTDDEILDYFNKAWNLYKQGDRDMTKREFRQTCYNHDIHPRKLYESYNEYILSLADFQAGKFTKSDKQIKKLYTFLNNNMFKQSYSAPIEINVERDHYLYEI